MYEPELEGLLNSMRRTLNQLRSFNGGAEEDEDDDDPAMGWDWREAPPMPADAPPFRGHHHHHHHRHGLQDMFGMIGGDTFRGKVLGKNTV